MEGNRLMVVLSGLYKGISDRGLYNISKMVGYYNMGKIGYDKLVRVISKNIGISESEVNNIINEFKIR